VPTKVIRYRSYTFNIYAPARQGDRWYLVIWSPSNAPPVTMSGHVSWEEAVQEAQAAVDHILDGSALPKL
jgi:hypothetical protein